MQDVIATRIAYRQKLIEAGIKQATKDDMEDKHWRFYKPVTEWTAFTVNLNVIEDGIEILYGYASTAFTKFAGDENRLIEWGVSADSMAIREMIVINDTSDEKVAAEKIGQMYCRYLYASKDELLAIKKEKQKQFIQKIAVRFKPMGFKKKGNFWTRPLTGEYYTMFNAQKSAFSDEFYFNVYIGKNGTNAYGDCYYTRVTPEEIWPLDWQVYPQEKFERFLDDTVVPLYEWIINTPLEQLGKCPSVCEHCWCERDKCEHCWVEKNINGK